MWNGVVSMPHIVKSQHANTHAELRYTVGGDNQKNETITSSGTNHPYVPISLLALPPYCSRAAGMIVRPCVSNKKMFTPVSMASTMSLSTIVHHAQNPNAAQTIARYPASSKRILKSIARSAQSNTRASIGPRIQRNGKGEDE